MIKIGDKFFGKHYLPKFSDWCAKKGYKYADIEKMNPKDKLKIVLRYKWITEDDRSAQECETTRKDVLETLSNIPPVEEGDKYWLKNALRWEYEINKIKAHFGLISQEEFSAMEALGG